MWPNCWESCNCNDLTAIGLRHNKYKWKHVAIWHWSCKANERYIDECILKLTHRTNSDPILQERERIEILNAIPITDKNTDSNLAGISEGLLPERDTDINLVSNDGGLFNTRKCVPKPTYLTGSDLRELPKGKMMTSNSTYFTTGSSTENMRSITMANPY